MSESVYTSLEDLPLVLTVEEAARVLRIGRSLAYEMARTGQIRSVKMGHRVLIPRGAIEEFLNGQPSTENVIPLRSA